MIHGNKFQCFPLRSRPPQQLHREHLTNTDNSSWKGKTRSYRAASTTNPDFFLELVAIEIKKKNITGKSDATARLLFLATYLFHDLTATSAEVFTWGFRRRPGSLYKLLLLLWVLVEMDRVGSKTHEYSVALKASSAASEEEPRGIDWFRRQSSGRKSGGRSDTDRKEGIAKKEVESERMLQGREQKEMEENEGMWGERKGKLEGKETDGRKWNAK